MFASKAEEALLYGRLLDLLTSIRDYAGKACQGQTLQLIMNIHKLWTYIYNIGASGQIL
jgi:hypothetical protein